MNNFLRSPTPFRTSVCPLTVTPSSMLTPARVAARAGMAKASASNEALSLGRINSLLGSIVSGECPRKCSATSAQYSFPEVRIHRDCEAEAPLHLGEQASRLQPMGVPARRNLLHRFAT